VTDPINEHLLRQVSEFVRRSDDVTSSYLNHGVSEAATVSYLRLSELWGQYERNGPDLGGYRATFRKSIILPFSSFNQQFTKFGALCSQSNSSQSYNEKNMFDKKN
jgi:hypothetical protein